jgi:hypothetical protein
MMISVRLITVTAVGLLAAGRAPRSYACLIN